MKLGVVLIYFVFQIYGTAERWKTYCYLILSLKGMS